MSMGSPMKLLLSALILFGVFVATAAEPEPIITVHGPTIVAFFEPVSEAQLKADPDTNEALSDFQVYASGARKAFKDTGIEFHEIYSRSFKIRMGGRTTTFRPGKITVGYYFVAPGKKPRIEYGVNTDSDLVTIANAYFSK